MTKAQYGDKKTITFHWREAGSSLERPETGRGTFVRPNSVEGYKAMTKFIKLLAAKQIPFSVTY